MKKKNNIKILSTIRNFKIESLFVQLFLILLTSSVIFTVINFLTSSFIKNKMINSAIYTQKLYMEYNIEIIDENLNRIKSGINSYIVDDVFNNAVYTFTNNIYNYGYEDLDAFLDNLKNLNKVYLDDEIIEDIYIYLDNIQSVGTVSGLASEALFFDSKYNDSVEDLKERFNDTTRMRAINIYDNEDNNVIAILNSLYYKSKKYGTIVIEVDVLSLLSSIKDDEYSENSMVYLVDKNGAILDSTSDEYDTNQFADIIETSSDGYNIINDGEYLIQWKKAEAVDLYLAVKTPIEPILGSINMLFKTTSTVIIITLLMTIIIAAYFARKIYMPVVRIVDFIRMFKISNYDDKENELSFIENNMSNIFKNYENMESSVSRSAPLILEALFKKIISEYRDIDTLQALVKDLSLEFHEGNYLAVVIRTGNTKVKHSQNEIDLFYKVEIFKMINRYMDDYAISVFKTKPNEAVIITFIDNENQISHIYKRCLQIGNDISKDYKFNCVIGIGSLCDSPYKVNESYRKAISAIEDRNIANASLCYKFEEDKQINNNSYILSEETMGKLYNDVTLGNVDSAFMLINEIFETNEKHNISYKAFESLVLTLIKNARRMLDTLPDKHAEEIGFVDIKPDECNEYEYNKNCVISDYKMIADAFKMSGNSDLLKSILNYIDENVSQNFGLIDIADFLGLTPNYLTRYFKEQMGINYTHYLANKRVEFAKNMLMDSNKTVKEISHLCGYGSSKQFISMFKKIVGTTPISYRNHYWRCTKERMQVD